VRAALIDASLVSPTVGLWRPTVCVGALLSAGQVLGTLVRAGQVVEVHAPAGVAGVAVEVVPRGWVAFGHPLVVTGAGGVVAGLPAAIQRDRAVPDDVTVIAADTDGTVYLRPDPGSPSFVVEGAVVPPHATLALIEVMKTFSKVRAPVAGVVARVCVEDGAAVESGAALFWIRAG
jgi:biotin carboxyl carrier protein